MPFDKILPTKTFGLNPIVFDSLNADDARKIDFAESKTISEIEELVSNLETEWKAKDKQKSLNKTKLNITEDAVEIVFFNDFSQTVSMPITNHALYQLGAFAAPKTPKGRKATPFHLGEAGLYNFGTDIWMRKHIEELWNYILKTSGWEAQFRTRIIDGRRTVVSVQGCKYAPIWDTTALKGVSDLFPDAVVTGWHVDTIVSNFRIIPKPDEYKDKSTPMELIDLYNSPSGNRGLWVYDKFWIEVCSNGAMAWVGKNSWNHRHYGCSIEILKQFNEELPSILNAEKSIGIYKEAQSIPLDFSQAVEEFFKGDKAFKKKLTVTPDLIASPKNTLGYMVDVITLTSQKFGVENRHEYEYKAGKILLGSVNKYQKNGWIINPKKEKIDA